MSNAKIQSESKFEYILLDSSPMAIGAVYAEHDFRILMV